MRAMPSADVSPPPVRASVGASAPSQSIRRKFHWVGHRKSVRTFPSALTRSKLPPALADEILEFYGFIFWQGGFRHLGMAFEQLLLMATTVRPGRLCPTYEYADARFQ